MKYYLKLNAVKKISLNDKYTGKVLLPRKIIVYVPYLLFNAVIGVVLIYLRRGLC